MADTAETDERRPEDAEDDDVQADEPVVEQKKPKFLEERLRRRDQDRPLPKPKRRPADDATEAARRQPNTPSVPSAKLREELVQNAVKFLSHPSVKNATPEKKGTFLRDHKGLTAEEVNEAFSRIGQPAPTLPAANTNPSPAASTAVATRPAAAKADGADSYGRLPPQQAWSPPPQPTPQQLAMMGYPVPPHMLAGYPPPPGYPVPPAAAAAAAAAGGFGMKTLMLTGLLTAGVAAGAAVLATNYMAKRNATNPKPDLPPAIEEKPKEAARDLRADIVSEVSKTMKDQTTSLNESVQALKAMLQSSVERKDSELADLKSELLTMKTRMKDLQLQASVAPMSIPSAQAPPSSPAAAAAPASPATTIPAWQQKSAMGANRWLMPGANTAVSPAAAALAPAVTIPNSPAPAAAPSTPAPAAATPAPAAAPTPAPAVAAAPTTAAIQPAVTPAPVSASFTPASPAPAAESAPFQGTSNPPKPADKPPYSTSFQSVMEMVARGETPPDVQDINDKPVPPPEPIAFKGSKDVPPKPWERGRAAQPPNWAVEDATRPAPSPPTPAQN